MWSYLTFVYTCFIAPIAVGIFINNFAATEGTDMETSIRRSSCAVCLCGVVLLSLHSFYMAKLIDKSSTSNAKAKKSKSKLTFFESVKFLLRSEYLGCVAVLVLSYGLLIQFTDIMWKSMVMRQFPEDIEYQRYFATFSSRVGMATFSITFLGRFREGIYCMCVDFPPMFLRCTSTKC
jgi:ATP:ADP antiporter, AAA family